MENITARISIKTIILTLIIICLLRSEEFRDITYFKALNKFNNQVAAKNIIQNGHLYTSHEIIDVEKQYMQHGLSFLSTKWQIPTDETVDKYIDDYQETAKANNGRALSDVQLAGVKGVLQSDKFITCLQGDAGAGKTTALKAANQWFKSQGIEVIGLAMQGVAAKTLADDSGAKSFTLASYLGQKETKGDGKQKVILFDEAGMLDSRNALALFEKAAKNGDKVVLIGDINQLGAISAGKPFERLVEHAEKQGTLIRFNENYRQKDPELRQAVDLIKQGKADECLEIIDKAKNGGIIELEDKNLRRAVIADKYDNNTLVLCNTKAARIDLNEQIREKLFRNGTLKESEQADFVMADKDEDGLQVERPTKLCIGEKIIFTQNEYKTYDIMNDERAEIMAIESKMLTVKTGDNRELKIDTETYPYIDYGYAMTTFKPQRQTYNKVVIDADTSISSLNDMRNAYVQITRCRENIKIYTDDKDYFKELAKERRIEKDTMDIITATSKQAAKEIYQAKEEKLQEQAKQTESDTKTIVEKDFDNTIRN
ncbi:MAG: AAA family ATPase [Elusimicrobiota bacterium]|jgi:ATP-dependent exoDNAse (exonuclease V) alpha subunit|nr:AAA family ATPase [Elusimicrobiota bacterium]